MAEVNYWIIYATLGGLEERELTLTANDPDFDPNDPEFLRDVFLEWVLPCVSPWSAVWKDKLCLSLAYYLHRPDVLTSKVLGNLQDLSLPEVVDIKSFFRVLWDVLFPETRLEDVNIDDVIENNDIMEMNCIR